MKNYTMISKITLWALLAIGIVISILFFVGGSNGSLEVAGDFLDIPANTNLFLIWNYVLVFGVILVTLAVVVREFVKTFNTDRKKAIKSLIVLVGFVLLIIVCWILGSSEEVKIIGYEGTDNVGAMAKLSDAMIYLTYILVLGTIVTIIWGVIYSRNRK